MLIVILPLYVPPLSVNTATTLCEASVTCVCLIPNTEPPPESCNLLTASCPPAYPVVSPIATKPPYGLRLKILAVADHAPSVASKAE